MADFDFDAWASLAKTAPDEFEQERRKVIEHFISTRENVQRMRGLQWRIDQERTRHRTTLTSCQRIFSLMWDKFLDFKIELGNVDCQNFESNVDHARSAKVLNFPQKR